MNKQVTKCPCAMWFIQQILCNYSLRILILISPIAASFDLDRLQHLDLGPCRSLGDAYCQARVVDSICSLEQNDCSCKPGFVAIQDRTRIVCTTLLTNLRCQVDSECIHVHGSTCHPGVGECACPAGTIYVPQLQACRETALYANHPVCLTCKELHGICYVQSHIKASVQTSVIDMRTSSLRDKSNSAYDCRCPDYLVSPKHLAWPMELSEAGQFSNQGMKHHVNLPQEKMMAYCSIQTVDIGEYCNQVDFICRSRNAICTQSMEWPYLLTSHSVCVCQESHLPVYQKNLGYYECFPQINNPSVTCLACNKHGGLCYSMATAHPEVTHCVCPHTWKPVNRKRTVITQSNSSISVYDQSVCQSELEVICTAHEVRICLQPQRIDLSSALESGIAVAYISDETGIFPNHVHCELKKTESNSKTETKRWCRSLSLTNTDAECAVNILKNGKNAMNIMGTVRVDFHEKVSTLHHRTMKHQFQCLSKDPGIIVRIHTGNVLSRWILSKNLVTMHILDENNSNRVEVYSNSTIRLVARWNNSISSNKQFNFEECFSEEYNEDYTAKHTMFLKWRCSDDHFSEVPVTAKTPLRMNHGNDRHVSLIPIEQAMSIRKDLKSASFLASGLFSSHNKYYWKPKENPTTRARRVRIHCLFRVCEQASWCTLPSWCSKAHRSTENKMIREPTQAGVYFTKATVQLSVLERMKEDTTDNLCNSDTKTENDQKQMFIMLVPGTLLVIVLTAIVVFLLLWVCKSNTGLSLPWKISRHFNYNQAVAQHPTLFAFTTASSSTAQPNIMSSNQLSVYNNQLDLEDSTEGCSLKTNLPLRPVHSLDEAKSKFAKSPSQTNTNIHSSGFPPERFLSVPSTSHICSNPIALNQNDFQLHSFDADRCLTKSDRMKPHCNFDVSTDNANLCHKIPVHALIEHTHLRFSRPQMKQLHPKQFNESDRLYICDPHIRTTKV